MKKNWEPGQHFVLSGYSGSGKTTFVGNLLKIRPYVLVFDVKGGDSTLRKFGYRRLDHWPLTPLDRWKIRNGEPARFILGKPIKNQKDLAANILLFRKVLNEVMSDRGWTIYIDELQLLSERIYGRSADHVTKLMIAARDRKESVVASFQGITRVPTAAFAQAEWIAFPGIRDRKIINRIAEVTGREREVVSAVARNLPRYHWAVSGRNPNDPILITHPPAL